MEELSNLTHDEDEWAEQQLQELIRSALPPSLFQSPKSTTSHFRSATGRFFTALKQLIRSFANRALFAKTPQPSRVLHQRQQVVGRLRYLLKQREWLDEPLDSKEHIFLCLRILQQLSIYLHTTAQNHVKDSNPPINTIKLLNKYYLCKLNIINK